jgi:hypothetical protein
VGGIWGVTRAKNLSPEKLRALGMRKRRAVELDTDLPIPKLRTYVSKGLPVRLSMETAQRTSILVMLFVCLFWNGIVGVFVGIGLFTDKFPWFVWLFLTPFILVGVAILAGLLKQILVALKVPDTVVELSQEPLVPGESVRIALSQAGSLNLTRLTVTVECEEKISYTRGTDTYHESRKVFSEPLTQTGSLRIQDLRPWRESVEFTVPVNAMHSFHAEHNEVVWKLVVKGELSGWPDFEFTYRFRVMPPGVREQMSWKRESLFA